MVSYGAGSFYLEVEQAMLQARGWRCGSTASSVRAQRARKVSTALIAWLYSHCLRRRRQSLAMTVQFCVRSEEHTSELQSLMRISYAVFCLKKKIQTRSYSVNRYTSKQV